MATTLAGTLNVGLDFLYPKADTGVQLSGIIKYTNAPTSYTNGSGSYQVNAAYLLLADTLAGTSKSFDLDYGAIFDVYGAGLIFTRIKFLYIKNLSTTASQKLTLTGDFLTQATVGVAATGHIVGPGGIYMLDNPIDGYAVTATTGDVITITNTVSFAYDIVLLGIV